MIKIKKINLKNLNFNTLAPFLIGVVILLFIIYIIFFRPATTNTTQTESPATAVEESQQFHKDKYGELLKELPLNDDDYVIQIEPENDVDYLVIYYKKDVSYSLDKAYLFLKQYGIFKGDERIKEKELLEESDQVGP